MLCFRGKDGVWGERGESETKLLDAVSKRKQMGEEEGSGIDEDVSKREQRCVHRAQSQQVRSKDSDEGEREEWCVHGARGRREGGAGLECVCRAAWRKSRPRSRV